MSIVSVCIILALWSCAMTGLFWVFVSRQNESHEREIAHLKNQYHHKTTIVGSESVLRSIWKDEM